MRFRFFRLMIVAAVTSLLTATGSVALARKSAPAVSPNKSPAEIIQDFSKNWDETTWRPKLFRGGYMRPLNDTGWKARMLALQGLVRHGKAAVPVLVKTLKTGTVPQRILAAQALGYLAPEAPVEALLTAAQSDTHPAVRLYAVDSLGMQGKPSASVNWQKLAAKERNRDVRKHIQYARERKGKPVRPAVVERLRQWNPRTLDSAVVGRPAPDFTAVSAQGKTVRLRDFRGKKNVVLVFIYGDT